MMVTVATKLVSILKETNAPSDLFGGKTEKSNTRNPSMTTTALNVMALPECDMVSLVVRSLSPVSCE